MLKTCMFVTQFTSTTNLAFRPETALNIMRKDFISQSGPFQSNEGAAFSLVVLLFSWVLLAVTKNKICPAFQDTFQDVS